MKRNISSIAIDLIKLDQENVRFGGDVAQNQREAISLLMANPDDARKLLRLAEDISEYGLDPTELQLVTPSGDGSYIVLEGNRRLTALKLLQNPDLCPEAKLVSSFSKAKRSMTEPFPKEIECSVVSSREEGDRWIEIKHTGENNGIGRVRWDSDIRDERRARHTGVESIGRQIRKLIRNNSSFFESNTVEGISKIPVTTLTRLFSSAPAQDLFFLKIENKALKPNADLKYIAPSVDFAISLFIDHNYNVNDIKSDSDRKRFLSKIPQEITPVFLLLSQTESQEDNHNKDSRQERESGKDRAGNNEEDTGEQNSQNSSPHNTRRRARASSRARKYLINWSLNIKNDRINEIYRELRHKIMVDECPNAVAVMFRVFLEVSCDSYIKDHEKKESPVTRDDNSEMMDPESHVNLSIKIRSVAAHLEKAQKITKGERKSISKRASTKDAIGSVDHFNQFVHSSSSAPIPSELKDIATEYKPFLEAIWQ